MSANSKQESGNRMLSRKFQYGTSSIIIVLIVLGIIVVINVMSMRHFVRADLTENKDFTVSDATKKVLRELDDIITIDAYFSKEVPPYVTNIKSQVNDIFDEYKAYSGGKVSVELVSMPRAGDDPELEQKARFLGIPPVQVNILEKDKTEVVTIYFGIVIGYEDRNEIIPVIQNVRTLEYDLTSAIIKVKQKPSEVKTVGYLTGHREYETETDYENVNRSLQKQYKTTTVDLSGGKKIPENVNTLIIGGPKDSLSEREKYEIDQFLMRGGKIVFLMDPVEIQQGLMAIDINSNLNDMLEHYGVKVRKSLLVDRASHSNASFSSGYVRYSLPYPYWPMVTKNQFNQDNPMVNQLERIVLQWATAVELVPSKVKKDSEEGAVDDTGKLVGIELCKSSQYSWMVRSPYKLSPQQRLIPTGELKSYPLAVAVSGKFDSFYADKPVPEPEAEADEDTPEVEPSADSGTEETIKESVETQIIVVGNARFITAGFLGQYAPNLLFFENAVDWLTLGDELISIRSRSVTDRPLELIQELAKENPQRAERVKLFVKIINICGASFLVVVFGLAKFMFKRRAKKVFETYSSLGGVG